MGAFPKGNDEKLLFLSQWYIIERMVTYCDSLIVSLTAQGLLDHCIEIEYGTIK